MAEDENDDQEWNIRFRQDDEMDFFTELALHEAERWIQVRDSCSRVFKYIFYDVITRAFVGISQWRYYNYHLNYYRIRLVYLLFSSVLLR